MLSADDQVSGHPADRLIRELIRSERTASPDEVREITERLATAPFDPREIAVPRELRGRTYAGRRLANRERAALVHLAQRVLIDAQWMHGTAEAAYLADLAEAVRDPSTGIVLYGRRGGSIAGALSPNRLPSFRRGRAVLPWIYVVYSADHGTIISGYQVSSANTIAIPADARWLT
jgi:hypothetical protein